MIEAPTKTVERRIARKNGRGAYGSPRRVPDPFCYVPSALVTAVIALVALAQPA